MISLMNQKLSDWASAAEIIASIAVVITLIILILGIRENTEVVRAGSYNDLLGNVDHQACNHFDRIGKDLWGEVTEVLNAEYRLHVEELCGAPIPDTRE